MKNLVLVGAGQLGSRHLQALSKVNFLARIEVVDPFAASLDIARARFNEMPANPNISGVHFYSSLSEVSQDVDLAIIATNADIRADVIRQLVAGHKVKNLVLEKVLFQKPDDYPAVQSLLESRGIKAWVNHPRRSFPFYKKLRQSLQASSQVSYKVQGGGWGLACNGLHMIDHLSFLTGEDELELNFTGLSEGLIRSKRQGFIEVSGTLAGRIGKHQFELFCHETASPVLITICSDSLHVVIDEANNWFRLATQENNWKWVEEKEKIVYFQSELSNQFSEDILTTGHCDLPTLMDATRLHVPFVTGLLAHINRQGTEKFNMCPIT